MRKSNQKGLTAGRLAALAIEEADERKAQYLGEGGILIA
jgi:hypothetical protein